MADSEVHRQIEGGNADFQAGCALSGFDLNPSVRITSTLRMKSDANTILISRRPGTDTGLSMMKGILQSVGGPLRFCHRPPQSMRGRWHINTMAGFYQPENAHAALKHFNGSPDVEARLVYTVYFTAPKEISDAVLVEVEELVSQCPEVQIAWEEPRNGMVTLRLSGTERNEIVDIKECLAAILTGSLATRVTQDRGHDIWHPFFATPAGKIWLQHLARDNGALISSDKLQQRVRIYDRDDVDPECFFRIKRKLVEKVIELDGQQETHSIKLNPAEFRKLIVSDTVATLQKKLGGSNVSLDILQKTLVLHCPCQTAWLITYELNLPLPPPAIVEALLECPQCGDATKDVKYSECGHVTCKDCFDHQLSVASSDLTSNHFPLLCWKENCGQPIAIKDLRKYAPTYLMDSLMKASLTYHIRSFPDVYRNCRTPDCKSVYLRNGSYETFTCPTCLTQTCTKCHAEPHFGWTCADFETHLSKMRSNERLLEDYKVVAGTKECPKCATLIEKVDGCNHVECSGCHGHICWVCLKVFAKSEGAYQHMNDAHGGNGLVDAGAEEEGSDFESDGEEEESEDEWEDDDDPDGERFAYNFWNHRQHQFW